MIRVLTEGPVSGRSDPADLPASAKEILDEETEDRPDLRAETDALFEEGARRG